MDPNKILHRDDFIKHDDKQHSPGRRHKIREELTPEERAMLDGMFKGSVIEIVEPVEEKERGLFFADVPAFNFHIQTLYKFAGDLEPSRLKDEIQRMIASEERLRTNYCLFNGELYRVVLSAGGDGPNIICQDLSHLEPEELDLTLERILKADMHQEFDLQGGPLFRIYSFRTGTGEYAVLLTISKLIASWFNMGRLLRRVGKNADSPEDMESVNSCDKFDVADNDSFSEEQITDQSIQDLPLPYERTPRGEYCQVIYHKSLPGNISSGLLRFMSGSRTLLLAALETAWGLLLMENGSCEDCCVPLLLSDSGDKSGSFYMLSVCLRKNADVSIEHTVEEQADQIAQKTKAARKSGGNRPYSHFLSFYDFFAERASYSAAVASPQGNIIARNLWAASGVKLGVYFRWSGNRISMDFVYDKSRFKPYSLEIISQKYLQILQKMLFDWKQPVADFSGSLPVSDTENEVRRSSDVKEGLRGSLYDAIAGLSFMKGVQTVTLCRDVANPKRIIYLKDKNIPRTEMEENFIFLVKGMVVRSISTGGELYNFLDTRNADSWLNESILIPKKKSRLSIEIVSEEAVCLLIPVAEMNRLMNDEPHIMKRMLLYAVSEMEKYQRFWTQM